MVVPTPTTGCRSATLPESLSLGSLSAISTDKRPRFRRSAVARSQNHGRPPISTPPRFLVLTALRTNDREGRFPASGLPCLEAESGTICGISVAIRREISRAAGSRTRAHRENGRPMSLEVETAVEGQRSSYEDLPRPIDFSKTQFARRSITYRDFCPKLDTLYASFESEGAPCCNEPSAISATTRPTPHI